LIRGDKAAQLDNSQRSIKMTRQLLAPAVDPVPPFEGECHIVSPEINYFPESGDLRSLELSGRSFYNKSRAMTTA
jgi:hypothetical protein